MFSELYFVTFSSSRMNPFKLLSLLRNVVHCFLSFCDRLRLADNAAAALHGVLPEYPGPVWKGNHRRLLPEALQGLCGTYQTGENLNVNYIVCHFSFFQKFGISFSLQDYTRSGPRILTVCWHLLGKACNTSLDHWGNKHGGFLVVISIHSDEFILK